MNIAILNLSSPDKGFDRHGNAAELIERWISPSFSEAKFSPIYIAIGEPLPDTPTNYDGYILSGSEKGVYDETEWMEPLKKFLDQVKEQKIPVFGICFGHQIMAEVFGGKAEKSDAGFVVGVHEYNEEESSYTAHAMHQDQVVEVPKGATVIASASYCPVAALNYDFPARSVQFHPEFQKPLVEDAIDAFEGKLLTDREIEHARDTMQTGTVEPSLYAEEIAEFFRQSIS
ncbi:MAG: type 1 glutamine amidotransferase [Granulosicoccus sp.]